MSGWDAAMTGELRDVYYRAYRAAARAGQSSAAAHDEGLRAVAIHAADIERETSPTMNDDDNATMPAARHE